MFKGRTKRLAPAAALMAVALYALWLWRCTEPHFALGDDYYLARAFAGEVGGVAETYNAYIHTGFAWLLHGLTLLFPGVWWFSWLQMAMLLLGGFGVLLGLTRTAEHAGLPGWGGFAAGLLFLWAFAMEYTVAVTFTTTAALLSAGAVCLLGGANLRASGRELNAPLLGSAGLLWCAGMLRSTAALPGLAFWLGLLTAKGLTCGLLTTNQKAAPAKRRGGSALRPLARILAVILTITGLLAGVRLAENALTPSEDGYRAFLDATVEPIDYGGLNRVSPQTLAELGWTEKETALVRSWYFLDENMSTDSFLRIAQDAESREEAPLAQRAKDGVKRVLALLNKAPGVRGFLLICLGLCGAALLAACLGRRESRWRLWAPPGCAALALGLLLYLGYRGRLPIRAAATVLLPCGAASLTLALEELAQCRKLRSWPAWAAALCCLGLACSLGVEAFAFCHRPDHGDPNQCVFAEVERYAAAHEDALLIGDRTLGVDVRMFPDRSQSAPVNLLPMWGGWNNHSQGYRAAFAAYGFRHDGFRITDFLGERVRLIAGADGISPEFIAYLEEQAGGPVVPVPEYQGDGFTVYSFQKEEGAASRNESAPRKDGTL